jgi:cytochrome c-type biogenesis protein CcmH/NrfF
MLAQGKSADAIKAAMVAEYGDAILLEPPDSAFNRLAWLFPYMIGGAGATAIGLVARRWSRKPEATAPTAAPAVPIEDAALRERLEDELQDLD